MASLPMVDTRIEKLKVCLHFRAICPKKWTVYATMALNFQGHSRCQEARLIFLRVDLLDLRLYPSK